MNVIDYVNRINDWPEYVKISEEKKNSEKKVGLVDKFCGMGENRVLCRFVFEF